MNLWKSGRNGFGLSLLGMSALTPIAIVAHAEIYLAPEQAAQIIFPGEKFSRQEVTIPDDKISGIESASDEKVRSKKLVVFVDSNKNSVFIDQVLGKHEMITYAVGIKPDGSVKDVEILEYRETYGQNVRNEWRKQFEGKTKADTLRAGKDIKVLSGATLSSAHLSAGVRRLLQTYDIVKSQL